AGFLSVVFIFCALFVIFTGCKKRSETPATQPVKKFVPPEPKTHLSGVEREKWREKLVEIYRLKPDHRFLIAVGDLHSVLSGEPAKEASATFESGSWSIRYDQQTIGTLPELPDFPDYFNLLVGWAKTEGQKFGISGKHSSTQTAELEKHLKFD